MLEDLCNFNFFFKYITSYNFFYFKAKARQEKIALYQMIQIAQIHLWKCVEMVLIYAQKEDLLNPLPGLQISFVWFLIVSTFQICANLAWHLVYLVVFLKIIIMIIVLLQLMKTAQMKIINIYAELEIPNAQLVVGLEILLILLKNLVRHHKTAWVQILCVEINSLHAYSQVMWKIH